MSDMDCPTVKELLSRDKGEIVTLLSDIYEHSAWVAEKLATQDNSGIKTVTALANSMKAIVDSSSREAKMELLCAHPDLCARVGKLEDLTAASQEEQSGAGLQSMTEEEMVKFTTLNTEYKTTFGFPFILAVRNATKHTVLAALQGRVSNSEDAEFCLAIQQVHKIAWMRILASINTDDAAGFLTCHILDTANGCPAENMRITLHRLSPGAKELIGEYVTNDDGRLEGGPALKGKDFVVGTYEWTFFVADYFAFRGTATAGTPFLDQVPLRFGIDNPDDHYHVPLLVSPWGFSTYRGS